MVKGLDWEQYFEKIEKNKVDKKEALKDFIKFNEEKYHYLRRTIDKYIFYCFAFLSGCLGFLKILSEFFRPSIEFISLSVILASSATILAWFYIITEYIDEIKDIEKAINSYYSNIIGDPMPIHRNIKKTIIVLIIYTVALYIALFILW